MAVDPLKVQVQVSNTEQLEKLKEAAARVDKEIVDLRNDFIQGKITSEQFGAQLVQLQSALRGVNSALRQTATEAHGAKAAMGGLGGGGAQNLLQMSYVLDNIQYGFRAIVNNIPQLGQGLGQALGLSTEKAVMFAGALGIVAVAANQVFMHWDQIEKAFGNTAPVEAAKGVMLAFQDALKGTSAASGGLTAALAGGIGPVGEYIKKWNEATEAVKEHERIIKQIAEATKTLEGIGGTTKTKEGNQLREAIERAGGGEAVVKAMTDEAARKGGITDKDQRNALADQIRLTLQRGLEGENIDKALPKSVRDQLDTLRFDDKAKASEALKKREFATDEASRKEQEKMLAVPREAFESDQKKKIKGLEDEKDILQARRAALQQQIADQPRNVTGDSVLNYADRIMKAGQDSVQKDSLKTLKDISKGILDLNDKIGKERKAVFSS